MNKYLASVPAEIFNLGFLDLTWYLPIVNFRGKIAAHHLTG